jgi:hypothetical protein
MVSQASGLIETLPAWRMWNDEVIAMGRKTEHGRGGASSSYGVARRVELAAGAMRALQQEIAECPPVAREIIGCREMLLGIACAINLGDQQCLQEACEVVVKCAQECSSRAGDAVVGCPSLLNSLCRKAMQTEDPMVIDTLTALSHQNDKMLWIVTTIIKVMRVERQCEAGLLRRFVKAWQTLSSQRGRSRTKNALLSATSSSSSIGAATTTIGAMKVQATTRSCDVDDLYLQTISARSNGVKGKLVQYEPQAAMTRDGIIAPSQSNASFASSIMRQGSTDSVPRPVGMQVSSLYSSWNTASTPLYSTFNGVGEHLKDIALATQFGLVHELDSTASSLSLPCPEDSCSTFTSVKSLASKDDDENPQSVMAMADRLMNRSQKLNSEVEILRNARALPEPKILPERPWTPQGQDIAGVQMTVPPDSLLFASHSSNVSPPLYSSFNGALAVPFAWKGAEFSMPSVAQTHLRSMAVHPDDVQERANNYERERDRARTSSAPPRLDKTETSYVTMTVKKAVCGAEVSQILRPARRELSPPRYLPPVSVNPVRASPTPTSAAENRGATTTQVPVQRGGYQSVCDVDNLYSYFSRGRAPTRNPPAQPTTHSYSVRSTSPYRSKAEHMAPASEMIVQRSGYQSVCDAGPARPSSPSTTRSVLASPTMRAASPQLAESNQQFHKLANEFAFQYIGVGARMLRDQSPQRSARDVRSPVMRSIVGASTIQVANFLNAPSREHTNTPLYSSLPHNPLPLSPRRAPSPLRQANVEMCDVDETPMQSVFIGYTSPTAKANDWVGAVLDYTNHPEDLRTRVDQDDDWC